MVYHITPVVCEAQSPAYGGGPGTVHDCIASLSTVSSILQCAILACRTERVGTNPVDFWSVADCLNLADRELWRVVEYLEQRNVEPANEEHRIRELIANLPW